MRKTTKLMTGALASAFVLGLSMGAVQACDYHDTVAQTPMPKEVADGSQTPIVIKPEQGS